MRIKKVVMLLILICTIVNCDLMQVKTEREFNKKLSVKLPSPTDKPIKYINIPDINFRNVVLNILNKSLDFKITEKDVLSIKKIDGSDKQIKDITGIRYFKNLEVLCLCNNQIENIYDLNTNMKLCDIDLHNNKIVDITNIRGLISIEKLNLNNNLIEDVSHINFNRNMYNNAIVYLQDNPLSNESINIYIPVLIANGIKIIYDKK